MLRLPHAAASALGRHSALFRRAAECRRWTSGKAGPQAGKPISTPSKPVHPSAGAPSKATENAAAEETDLYIGTHVWRLVCAFGFVYVFTEYGIELTICEGPSMLPTIRPRGEIVLMDRFTPRWYGLQGGSVGRERARQARALQREHEDRLAEQPQSSSRTNGPTWHQPMVPANRFPKEGAWERFWGRQMSGISVGDVVVVQHPDRVGTVCKRVLGLPGDVVTKPSWRSNIRQRDGTESKRLLRRTKGTVVPDGHIWVEGDNPWNSSDSRNYGPVPAGLIVGRVLFRVWPLRGDAMMERGARPERDRSEEPQMTFSGSVVIPAGYENQVINEDYVPRT